METRSIYHSTMTQPLMDEALARNDLRWIPQNTVLVELSAYLAGRGHRLMWDRTLRRLTTTPIPPAEPT